MTKDLPPSKNVTVNHLRNLVLCCALSLSLGSCVFVPLDYYEPPRPTRYMQGDAPPPTRYRDRYYEDRYADRGERRPPHRRGDRPYRYERNDYPQPHDRQRGDNRGRDRERRMEFDGEADPTAEDEDPSRLYRPSGPQYGGQSPDMRGIEKPKPAPKPADLPDTAASKPPASSGSVKNSDVPKATRSEKPGRVKSPFPPYGELDVSGMQSGSLAKDPSNGKIFRVP